MENKAHALAAGLFVALAAALLLTLATWLSRDGGGREVFEISTRETVSGLQEQAPVRYRGVNVGKVTSIGFDPQAQGSVLVRLALEPQAPVTRGTFATLDFQGVTGLAFVQLDDDGKPAPRLVPDGGAPPRIPLRPGLISRLTDRGDAILDRVEQAAARLHQLLDEPNQQRVANVLDRMAQAAESVDRLAARSTAIVEAQLGPARTSIPQTVSSIGAAVASLHRTSDEARAALTELGGVAQKFNAAGGPVDRLAEGAVSLSQAAESFGAGTLPRVNQVADETARAARQLQRVVGGIEDNPQSLIFGGGSAEPGPGESGFVAPGGAR